jgi:hypothetical protein
MWTNRDVGVLTIPTRLVGWAAGLLKKQPPLWKRRLSRLPLTSDCIRAFQAIFGYRETKCTEKGGCAASLLAAVTRTAANESVHWLDHITSPFSELLIDNAIEMRSRRANIFPETVPFVLAR